MKRIVFLLGVLLLPVVAQGYTGTVVHVFDGDTILVQRGSAREKVRLYGIDAPESGQAHGSQATAWTQLLLQGKEVEVFPQGTDKYGRSVAIIALEGVVVQELLLESGTAWVYPQFCKAIQCVVWRGLEWKARAYGNGLWKDQEALPPWVWRKKHGKQF